MQSQQQVNIPVYQWTHACIHQTFLQAEIARTAGWMKYPEETKEANLVSLVGHWFSIKDLVYRLPEDFLAPVGTSDRIYSLEYIRTQNNVIYGMLKKLEGYRGNLYQDTLNKQLFALIEMFNQNLPEVDVMDEMELSSMYSLRDKIENVLLGIDVIRAEYPRLNDIEFDRFEQAVKKADQLFHKAVRGRSLVTPYSPETFWWRK